jgi:hypothetical protein
VLSARQAALVLDVVGGHPPDSIEERGNGFFYAHCSCGYVSARRNSPNQAAEALIHHMRKVATELVANGVSIPGLVGDRH